MKLKPVFGWHFCFIGTFWDEQKKWLYIFPLPMVGFKIQIFGSKCYVLRKRGYFYRPNAAGYTNKIEEAGRFTFTEASQREYPYDEPVTKHHIASLVN